MDIFDVLNAISTKKSDLIRIGMNEHEALIEAIHDISTEFHIPLFDIEKLIGIS